MAHVDSSDKRLDWHLKPDYRVNKFCCYAKMFKNFKYVLRLNLNYIGPFSAGKFESYPKNIITILMLQIYLKNCTRHFLVA